jgi:predicted metal-dependent enzyme (double-stranded beta helix superfamily)
MATPASSRILSRRDVLIGAGAAIAAANRGARAQPSKVRAQPKFDVQSFIDECKRAGETGGADSQAAVRDVLTRAISEPKAVLAGVGAPEKGGIRTLYRSANLTILNIVWSPLMVLMPHEHRMWSLLGIYTGREDNIFWDRRDQGIAAVKAAAIAAGNVLALPSDVIHSVTNPIEKLTGAIHIYGGDFFAKSRSEWDPETLTERDWNIQRAVRIFEQSNNRFFGWQKKSTCR